MKTRVCPRPQQRRAPVPPRAGNGAYLLAELLVYMTVLLIIVAVGYAAMFRCWDASAALRRNTRDISSAVQAGERWRDDVRGATGQIRLETNSLDQVLYLPHNGNEIAYLFSTNTVLRRIGTNTWTPLLENVQSSSIHPDRRQHVTAWQWDLELQTRAKKNLTRIKPLFTFVAVPGANP